MAKRPAPTPGPWLFDPTPRLGTALIKVDHSGWDQTIARVFAMPRKGEREANAALMSAAPRLLLACQAALGYLTQPTTIDKADLITALESAIAYATRDVSEVPA